MNLRTKLIWTLTIILLATVATGSTYAIYSIRSFILDQAVTAMKNDGYWMMHTLRFLPEGVELQEELERIAQVTDYHISLYDSGGSKIAASPGGTPRSPQRHLSAGEIRQLLENEQAVRTINDPGDDKIGIYGTIADSRNMARFFVINQSKIRVFQSLSEIRRVIYIGMVISMFIILIFSVIVAYYMARPLLKLTSDVQRIAKGDTGHIIRVKRSDEIGELAESVNKMAQKLRSDFDQLQDLNEKQQQFFADITHELRNPLHTLMGSLEMLELPKLDEKKRRKYVKNLRSQAERIGRLFRDLMTLQRFDSDKNFIIHKHVNLADIAGNVAEWYLETAKSKGLELRINSHPCMIYADPGKIEQVLDNLVSNSIKFTNEGSVSVTYRSQDNHVEVAVKDTGIGVPEEHLSRLYDRFYRTDKARSRDKGGTGLGLSVVKGILKAHGSDILMESEIGKGSRFYFYLQASNKPPGRATELDSEIISEYFS